MSDGAVKVVVGYPIAFPAADAVFKVGASPARYALDSNLSPSRWTAFWKNGVAVLQHATAVITRRTIPLALILLAFAAPVYAEDADPWLEIPRGQLADLLAKSTELDATRVERDTLKVIIAAQDAQIKAQAALIKTQDDMLERQTRLTALADEERDVHRGRADRITKDAGKGNLWLRVQARAGAGALIGVSVAPIFPPAVVIGPLFGAAIGLLEHWLID